MAMTKRQVVVASWLFFGYVQYNVGRRGFGLINAGLQNELGLTLAELGWISTLHSVAYGASKFAGSLLADVFPNRLLFSVGLAASALCNLGFAVSHSVVALAGFWTVNGLVQGLGWPALAGIIVSYFAPQHRGRLWSLASFSVNASGSLVPALFSAVALYFDSWRAGMLFASLSCGFTSLACLFYLPSINQSTINQSTINQSTINQSTINQSTINQSINQSTINQSTNKQTINQSTIKQSINQSTIKQSINQSTIHQSTNKQTNKESTDQSTWQHVITSPTFWALCASDTMTYFALRFFSEWWLLYALSVHHVDQMGATALMTWYETAGAAGTLSFGLFSDMAADGRRLTVSLLLLGAALPGVALLSSAGDVLPLGATLRLAAGVSLLGFGLCSAKSSSGLLVSEAFPAARGFAAALFGVVGQLGNVAAGVPVGWAADAYGWPWALTLVATAVLLGWSALLLLWLRKPHF